MTALLQTPEVKERATTERTTTTTIDIIHCCTSSHSAEQQLTVRERKVLGIDHAPTGHYYFILRPWGEGKEGVDSFPVKALCVIETVTLVLLLLILSFQAVVFRITQ